ncbi:hypothetical protein SKAU_G00430650 [Synaphobranchus kaupii]|uniref:Uncharacterized protein n=1 Tax=Synaphobranchus kaupii TaxID=118154 RepID=A0A9Q1E489_SYNKA|nr:hypothetical protein SKAU_G00430650 [Synaphobranchus kaupii]
MAPRKSSSRTKLAKIKVRKRRLGVSSSRKADGFENPPNTLPLSSVNRPTQLWVLQAVCQTVLGNGVFTMSVSGGSPRTQNPVRHLLSVCLSACVAFSNRANERLGLKKDNSRALLSKENPGKRLGWTEPSQPADCGHRLTLYQDQLRFITKSGPFLRLCEPGSALTHGRQNPPPVGCSVYLTLVE